MLRDRTHVKGHAGVCTAVRESPGHGTSRGGTSPHVGHDILRQDPAMPLAYAKVPQGLAQQVPSAGLRPELASARSEAWLWLSLPLLPGWLDDEAEQNGQMPPEAERKASP